jgi:hypothetical protein
MDELLENDEDVVVESELDLLKERAVQMGVSFHPAIGVDKLRDKINAVLNSTDSVSEDEISEPTVQVAKPSNQVSKADLMRQYHVRLRQEANKLIRVRVTCMNPNKKDWPGEIISVSNAVIGTVKKYVPFNIEEGYHIPAVLLTLLKERQYQHFTRIKLPNGRVQIKPKMLPEFAIEEMTPLTKQELDALAQRQAMSNSVE